MVTLTKLHTTPHGHNGLENGQLSGSSRDQHTQLRSLGWGGMYPYQIKDLREKPEYAFHINLTKGKGGLGWVGIEWKWGAPEEV